MDQKWHISSKNFEGTIYIWFKMSKLKYLSPIQSEISVEFGYVFPTKIIHFDDILAINLQM